MTTQSRRRFTQFVLGLVTVLLASTLVFLYLKAARDQTASYTQSRDLIRQLQQLNAQWDSEVLKARIAITHNYDPLVTPLTEMTRIWAELNRRDTYHNPSDLSGWQATQAAYQIAVRKKPGWWTSSNPTTPCCATPGIPADRRRRHPGPVQSPGRRRPVAIARRGHRHLRPAAQQPGIRSGHQ